MNGFLIGVALFLIYDVIWLKEDFCVYICPYSRIQSVLYDDDTIMAVYSNTRGGKIYDGDNKLVNKQKDLAESDECTACEKCVTVCPTHIDIRKGLQLECINCLECSDACTVVQSKFDRPSLISWSSEKEVEKGEKTIYFRQKVIAYIVILLFILGMMIKMGSTKENMLLNINRTTQLYSIKADNRVENYYTFLFQNTQDKDHKFYFEVVGHDDIKILRPSKPFLVKSGKPAKKVVVLYTNKKLSTSDDRDTPIDFKIRAYAVDDKENIVVERETVFFYPRADQFKK
jgi:cytochrome c oxidase accessory protein FixG